MAGEEASNRSAKDFESGLRGRSEPTLLNLITNVRTGQLTTGPLTPNRWLVYTARDKTSQEKKIEKAFESCTFKAIMSFVVGKYLLLITK